MIATVFEKIKHFIESDKIEVTLKDNSLVLALQLDNSDFGKGMHAIFSVLFTVDEEVSFSLAYKAPSIMNCMSADFFRKPINGEDLFQELLVDQNDSDSSSYRPELMFNYRSAYHKQEDEFEMLVKVINELFYQSRQNMKFRRPI